MAGGDDSLLVTAVQAAQLGGVSERTIRRWIARGKLPATRIAPNRFAIRITDINECTQDRDTTLARRVALLEARGADLEARVAHLEQLLNVSALPARPQGQQE